MKKEIAARKQKNANDWNKQMIALTENNIRKQIESKK